MTAEEYGRAYERGLRKTISFLRSKGIPPDLAIEIAQQSWAKGWFKIHQLKTDGAVIIWVNSIAFNDYRTFLRQNEKLVDSSAIENMGSDGNILAVEENIRMEKLLDLAKDAKDRELLLLNIQGFSNDEIAERKKVTPLAVRIRMTRARNWLRETIEKKHT